MNAWTQRGASGSGMKRYLLPLLVLVCSASAGVAAERTGKLHLEVSAEGSAALLPARLEVEGADGKFVVAHDALAYGADCTMSKPGAGPLDDAASRQKFSGAVALDNPYTRSKQFYSAGRATLTLPAGTANIRVFKGPEYAVAKVSVDVPADGEVESRVILKRWADMPSTGWFSADDHLHIQRSSAADNPRVSALMQAEDLHVANLLQMGKVGDFAIAQQYAHGPAGHYQDGHHILAAGQENPRTHFLGHTITLGAAKTHFNEAQYLIYRLIWQETVKEGAINGFAHAIFPYASFIAPHDGIAVVLPHGLLHFLEVLQFDRIGYDVWYDLLALGLRITPTAGSDYPCGGQLIPGHERFYTRVEGELSYAAWLDGVRNGRTFVTTGPLVALRVNGEDIGGTVVLDAPAAVEISGSVVFDPLRDDVSFVEILHNGDVVARISRLDDSGRIEFALRRRVASGAWLAVRGFGTRRDEAPAADPIIFGTLAPNVNFHSAPVYVTVKGRPGIAQGPRARAVAQAFLARLDDLERVLDENNLDALARKLERPTMDAVPGTILRANQPALLQEIELAKAYFRRFIE